jgi:hypothetical protein
MNWIFSRETVPEPVNTAGCYFTADECLLPTLLHNEGHWPENCSVGLCCRTKDEKSVHFRSVDHSYGNSCDLVVASVCENFGEKYVFTASLFSIKQDYDLLDALFPAAEFCSTYGRSCTTVQSGRFFARKPPVTPGRKVRNRGTPVSAEEQQPHLHAFAHNDSQYGFLFKDSCARGRRFRVNIMLVNDSVVYRVFRLERTVSGACAVCGAEEARFDEVTDDPELLAEVVEFFNLSADDLIKFEAARRRLVDLRNQHSAYDKFVELVKKEESKSIQNRSEKKAKNKTVPVVVHSPVFEVEEVAMPLCCGGGYY